MKKPIWSMGYTHKILRSKCGLTSMLWHHRRQWQNFPSKEAAYVMNMTHHMSVTPESAWMRISYYYLSGHSPFSTKACGCDTGSSKDRARPAMKWNRHPNQCCNSCRSKTQPNRHFPKSINIVALSNDTKGFYLSQKRMDFSEGCCIY